MEQFKTPLKYGLYGAIIGFVFYLMLLFSGNSPWGSSSWLGCWIPGMAAFFGAKVVRDSEHDGFIAFGKVFVVSMVVIFTQAFIFEILAFIFNGVISVNSVELYKTEIMNSAEQIRAFVGDEAYYEIEEEMEKETFFGLVLSDFSLKIIGGALVSLIIASIVKKNKPIFDQE